MQGHYKSFIGRLEAIANDRGDMNHKLKGFYASADRQIAQRWFTGLRVDAADRAGSGRAFNDKAVAATLTPSACS